MARPIAALTALLLVATSGPTFAASKRDPAADEYERARGAYFALKADASRRKFRHNWLNVVRRFEAVAKKYPKSERAPDALYTAGDLLNDLSRISRIDEDLQAAIADFTRLIDQYPNDNLADDAALALARIHVDRTGDTDRAREIVERALKLPKGDMRGQLLAVKKTLPARPAPKPTGKRIDARPTVARLEPAPEPEPSHAPDTPRNGAAATKEISRSLLDALARVSPPGMDREGAGSSGNAKVSAARSGSATAERGSDVNAAAARAGSADREPAGTARRSGDTGQVPAQRDPVVSEDALARVDSAADRGPARAAGIAEDVNEAAAQRNSATSERALARTESASSGRGMTRTSGSLEDSDELASRGNPATSARTLAQVDSAATDRGMARTAGSSGEVNEAAVRRNSSERAQARTESASTDRETTRTAGRSEDANAERALAPAEPNRTAGRAWNGAEASADAKATAARLESAVASRSPDEATIAQQLGLKVRRVVIDAGHGGHDTGAIGKQGTNEKDITLKLARRVGELLADQGLEVILTRDDDTFVRLEDRTRIANEAKGDLFISIHCNASENRKVHGIETYTLNVASDRYSIRLAARENAASEKSISDLQFILADLATKANTEESERLAKRVQGSLVSTLRANWSRVKDFGTKQALFYVLLGAKMPAVLVETSFISNPEEEKRLSSKKYQEDVARAIARGVQSFLEDRERLARVD